MPYQYDVMDFGANGNGIDLDTKSIQRAIDECARLGGGSVVVPAGKYHTGSIFLKSDVTLRVESGALLLGSEDEDDYPVIRARWEGSSVQTHAPLISGEGLENIALIGRGTIDGRGAVWWARHRDKTLKFPRPRLVSFTDCKNVLIEGISVRNSPSWTINPVRCENVVVRGLTINNPDDSPNTDGINPDSCSRVRISDCYVSVGDDCITIKAGTEHESPELRAPCRDIAITNCTLERGHGGVVLGSEMSGGIRNVVISNCVFNGTDRGIRMKSRRGRGGAVEDVRVSNIIMTDVLCPFTMNLYYGCGAWGDPVVSDKRARPIDAGTPAFRGISLNAITARSVKYAAAFIYGLAEMPVENVSLTDISITMSPESEGGTPEMADGIEKMSGAGFFAKNARGLKLTRVEVRGQRGPAFRIEDSENVDFGMCGSPSPAKGGPVVRFANVSGAFVHGCAASPGTDTFLGVEGSGSGRIALSGNDLSAAKLPVGTASEVPPDAVRDRP